MDTSSQPGKRSWRVWPIVLGLVLFAALMALRYELSSFWARAAAAGCAFAVLGLSLVMSRGSRA